VRTSLCKADLEQVAQETGWEIRVAHYPPYTSKYNPIEHRLFPHLTRACQGVICTSIDVVKDWMVKATTKTGFAVSVSLLNKVYTTGRKVAANVKEQMRVVFDETLPQWNYRVLPGNTSVGKVISFLILRHIVARVSPGQGLCSHAAQSARSHDIGAETHAAPGGVLPRYQKF
jgi:DDE family transposase